MRTSFFQRASAAVIALALAAAPSSAQTLGSATPDNGVAPFGRDSYYDVVTGSIAQTFTAPDASPLLTWFRFFLNDNYDGGNLQVQANVFRFETDHVTGPALYTSSVRSGSTNIEGYDPYTFSGVDLLLAPLTTYAFVLRTTAGSPDGSTNGVGTTAGNTFALGQLYTSTGSTDAEISANGAFVASSGDTFGADAAIEANFEGVSEAPEPASLVLFGTGLLAVARVSRRRRSIA